MGCCPSTNLFAPVGCVEAIRRLRKSIEADRSNTFVVVLTSHHLELEAVIVAPMIRRDLPVANAELRLPFGQDHYVVSLLSMAAIDPKRLRRNVGSLEAHGDEIQRGLHRLFTGF